MSKILFSKKASMFSLLFIILANLLLLTAVASIFKSYEHFPTANEIPSILYDQEQLANRISLEQDLLIRNNVVTLPKFYEYLQYRTDTKGKYCAASGKIRIDCVNFVEHYIQYQDAVFVTILQSSVENKDISSLYNAADFTAQSSELQSGYYLAIAKKDVLENSAKSSSTNQLPEPNSYFVNAIRFKSIKSVQVYEGKYTMSTGGVLSSLFLLQEPEIEEKFIWTPGLEVRFFILPTGNDQGFMYTQNVQSSIEIPKNISVLFDLSKSSDTIISQSYLILADYVTPTWDDDVEDEEMKEKLKTELQKMISNLNLPAQLTNFTITSSSLKYEFDTIFILDIAY
jgi:hypothetical protein